MKHGVISNEVLIYVWNIKPKSEMPTWDHTNIMMYTEITRPFLFTFIEEELDLTYYVYVSFNNNNNNN